LKARSRFVGRGGLKLEAALERFRVQVRGKTAADFGSHVGGFVDCLLQAGAAKVYAIDTGHGTLAWKLRQDPRVVVMERRNALHVSLPEKVDIVTIDVGWTPQRLIVPKALECLRPGGWVVSLLKPQYEATPSERIRGVVKPEARPVVVERVKAELEALGAAVNDIMESPLPGGGGNKEYFLLIPSEAEHE